MIEPVTLDELGPALGLGDHELISLVGGGGKTTVLFTLGRHLGPRTILTTTTRMGREQTGGFPVIEVASGPDSDETTEARTDSEVSAALDREGTILARRRIAGSKAVGVDGPTCDRWFDTVADHVVVEADGSRRRPFKAPGAFEPVVPSTTTLLLACVGADAFGRVIADACHRPLRLAAIAGCSPYQRLTPERLAAVLLSERGSRKGCPHGARSIALLNQVTDHHLPFVSDLTAVVGSAIPIVAISASGTGS